MARVSVVYDKDIKEQVFMVRGDERYTHSTKTVIELRDIVEEDDYGYVQELFVNVYRDIGEANLIVYDNDVVINVIDDWSSTDTGRVIELPQITYEGEHNIKVKYMGNNQCSPSMSNLIHIDSKENPNKEDIPLHITASAYTDINSTISCDVYFEDRPASSYGKEIKVYFDDELKGTATIDSSTGNAHVEFNTGLTPRLATIKAVFGGSLFMNAKTVSKTVSVGYKLEVVSAPQALVTGDTVTFEVQVRIFGGLRVLNKNIKAVIHDIGPDEGVIASGTTNYNGVASLTAEVVEDMGDGTIDFVDTNNVVLNSIKLPHATVTSITLTKSTPRLYRNEECILSADINQNVQGIPVTFEQVNCSDDEHRYSIEALTDMQGNATASIKGYGMGQQCWKAIVGETNSTRMEIRDYYQYWDPYEVRDVKQYSLTEPGILLKLSSRYRIYMESGITLFRLNVPEGAFKLQFDNASIGTTGRLAFIDEVHEVIQEIDIHNEGILIKRTHNGILTIQKKNGKTIKSFAQQTQPTILFAIEGQFGFSRLRMIRGTGELL